VLLVSLEELVPEPAGYASRLKGEGEWGMWEPQRFDILLSVSSVFCLHSFSQ
jgi:hypothetical protein